MQGSLVAFMLSQLPSHFASAVMWVSPSAYSPGMPTPPSPLWQLQEWLAAASVPGIVETCPGVRSLMIEYDNRVLSLATLLELLHRAEAEMPPAGEVDLPSRIIRLPLSFDDPACHEAIAKYIRSVRAVAPFLPSECFPTAANG